MKNVLHILLALLFVSGSSYAQKTFRLNEKISEKGSFCFDRQAAVDIANGGNIDAATAILQAHIEGGACAAMNAVIVYSRKVYQYGDIRVYEGKIGNTTIFNPTLDIAEGEEET